MRGKQCVPPLHYRKLYGFKIGIVNSLAGIGRQKMIILVPKMVLIPL